jgi:hypothetical protein
MVRNILAASTSLNVVALRQTLFAPNSVTTLMSISKE